MPYCHNLMYLLYLYSYCIAYTVEVQSMQMYKILVKIHINFGSSWHIVLLVIAIIEILASAMCFWS